MADKVLTYYNCRRNQVSLLEREGALMVCKKFAEGENADNEAYVLSLLKGIGAPKFLGRDGNTLFIEYIEGKLFLDCYIEAYESEMSHLGAMLGRYIKDFYEKTGLILTDLNFRNFIMCGEELKGVDFEQAEEGELLISVSKAAAFAALYETESGGNDYFIE
jgi:hypothetical protein